MTQELFELAIVILFASVFGVIAKIFRQPVILAYLLTGVVVSAFTVFHFVTTDTFKLFSDLGVMFLLFLVGLEINYSSIRLVGGPALMLGLGQIILTFFAGFILSGVLGFSFFSSVFISLAFTFSSTIIVVKLLSDSHDLHSLYGKLSIGLLLVQDIVAIFILLFLGGVASGVQPEQFSWINFLITFVKGGLLFVGMFFLGKRIVPRVFDRIGNSQELLFLLSLAWLFVVAAVVAKIGFSIEIAGFLAGFALANSSEHFQIATKMRPLRDFFILGFFVFLGSSIGISKFVGFSWHILVFLVFILIIKPIITMGILFALGYRKRTNFFTGVTISQVSEFSFVLVALGVKLEYISQEIAGMISIAGVLSILFSSYFTTHIQKIFSFCSRFFIFFERKKTREFESVELLSPKPIVLIGCHRTGDSILLSLPKKDVLVVDFDPEVIHRLKRRNICFLFGDMNDEEIFEKSRAVESTLVISTSPKLEDNELLFSRLKKNVLSRPLFIARAETERDALILYELGVDYVLLPHFTSGQYLGKTIAIDHKIPILSDLKLNDLELLRYTREL